MSTLFSKRPRLESTTTDNEGKSLDSSQSPPIFSAEADGVMEKVEAVSAINDNAVQLLMEQWRSTQIEKEVLSNTMQRMESDLLSSSVEKLNAKLNSLECQNVVNKKMHLVENLLTQLSTTTSITSGQLVDNVSRRVEECASQIDLRLDSQLNLNEELTSAVQSMLSNLLEALRDVTRQAMQLEIEHHQKNAALAHLLARNEFLALRSQINNREVRALMDIVNSLIEKAANMEAAQKDLRRSKRHVRILERHLDLHGIGSAFAEAQLQEEEESEAAATEGGVYGLTPPPAPDARIRTVAPQYYALKFLEHKELTISDLFDELVCARRECEEHKKARAEMMQAVRQLQHDAMMVHQSYLEEKQRRENADRRIVQMAKERLRPTTRAAFDEDMTRMRENYSKVVDDATQLAVSVTVAREELRVALEERDTLRGKIEQMERDAQTDRIFQTLSHLRALYDDNVSSVENALVLAETQRRVATNLVQQQREEYSANVAAASRSAALNHALSEELHGQHERAAWRDPQRGSRGSGGDDVESSVKAYEAAISDQTSALQRAIDGLEQRSRDRAADMGASLSKYSKQIEQLVSVFQKFQSSTSPASTESKRAGGAQGYSSSHSGTAQAGQADRKDRQLRTMRGVLQKCLQYLFSEMKTMETQRALLLDRSLSDSDFVSTLQSELQYRYREIDSLQSQLRDALHIVSQNSLTVAESATQQQLSVEDSLNATEAKERIDALSEELEELQLQLAEQQLALEQQQQEKTQLTEELENVRRTEQLAVAENAKLRAALQSSHSRERIGVVEILRLQDAIQSRLSQSLPLAASTDTECAIESESGEGEDSCSNKHHNDAAGEGAQLHSISSDLHQSISDLQNDVSGIFAAAEASRAAVEKQREQHSTTLDALGAQQQLVQGNVAAVAAHVTSIIHNLQRLFSARWSAELDQLSTLATTAAEGTTTPAMEAAARQRAAQEARSAAEAEAAAVQRHMESRLAEMESSVQRAQEHNGKLLQLLRKSTSDADQNRRRVVELESELAALRQQAHHEQPTQESDQPEHDVGVVNQVTDENIPPTSDHSGIPDTSTDHASTTQAPDSENEENTLQ